MSRTRGQRPLVPSGARRSIALAVFFLAFTVRAIWAIRVQSPLTAVYSDMGGYVSRAEMLLSGFTPNEPRVLVLWPWGTHAIVALEIALLGRKSAIAIGIVHAIAGAIAAPCAALITARFVRSPYWVWAAGVVVALWHPHVVYSGFFSSEIWFSSAIALGSLCLIRHCERRSGAVVAGLLLGLSFCVRPQILLTVAMLVTVFAVAWLRRATWRPRGGALALAIFFLPLAAAMTFSSVRFHRLTGRFGLIAAYEPAQRLFGETNVGKIEASWIAPNGDRWGYWFSPHTKQPLKPEHVVHIDGFICDPEKIAAIRAERLRGVPLRARIGRMVDNVELLALRNVPWPEDDFRRVPFRARLQRVYAEILLVVIALAAVGLASLRRHRAAGVILGVHLVTIVGVAAIYLGEARYRVPYDPLIIVVATIGASALAERGRALVRRARAGS
ncbi:MAG: hypothetical protein KF819_26310 [Labilithrix sp.]|nr:hypothetical protein [Labilithrix sp.]